MIIGRIGDIVILFTVVLGRSLVQGDGSHHSQNIRTNNGITVQVNVENNLRRIAKAQIDERGWMRLLTPAHDSAPAPATCANLSKPKATRPLVVLYGTNGAICPDKGCVIISGKRGNQEMPLLSVRRVKTSLLLDAKVFDENGNIIANIVGDKPHINRNFVSDWSRPDEHTLSVTDNHDKRVLYVRFLNEISLYIEGSFYLPADLRDQETPQRHLELTSGAMRLFPSGATIDNSCMGGATGGSMIVF